LFVVRTPARDQLRQHLSERGIETLVHYPVPIPRQPALAPSDPRQCPVADRICAEVLSLPMYPALTDADIAAVVDAVNRYSPTCAS
jgi:dTDP-4-amino-4,6-dideoxygalactose transaminase